MLLELNGWATFEIDSEDEWNRTTVALAWFAEYSNVGGNMTGGLGERSSQNPNKRELKALFQLSGGQLTVSFA